MVSLFLLSHGDLAKALENSLRYSSNCKIDVSSYCLYEEDDLERFAEDLEKEISEKERNFDVVVGTDLAIGSPANVVYSMLKKHDINVIANINLQQIIYINNGSKDYDDIKELLKKALESGSSKLINRETFGEVTWR